jgi:hypothetical protein
MLVDVIEGFGIQGLFCALGFDVVQKHLGYVLKRQFLIPLSLLGALFLLRFGRLFQVF